jgi:hypothetical protein
MSVTPFKMRKASIVATCVLAFATASLGAAKASELSGGDIKEAIGGKTVMLKTRWGGFPLRYASSGAVTGDGSALGLARFFAPKETGRWWVQGNQLCQQFPTWYKGKSLCFTLARKDEKTLKWVREDGYSGTAVVQG